MGATSIYYPKKCKPKQQYAPEHNPEKSVLLFKKILFLQYATKS